MPNPSSISSGISHRSDGQMKFGSGTNGTIVLDNRERFFRTQGLDPSRIVSAWLVHGTRVVVVDEQHANTIIPETDALISNTDNLILTVTVADCLPIIFSNPEHQAFGVAHAGWRGVRDDIVTKVIQALNLNFWSNPHQIAVHIGPHIRSCHFEVGEEVIEQFASFPEAIRTENNRPFIDLSSIVRSQLIRLGVLPESITISPDCTHCDTSRYFSFRRDKPERVEAMVAWIGMG